MRNMLIVGSDMAAIRPLEEIAQANELRCAVTSETEAISRIKEQSFDFICFASGLAFVVIEKLGREAWAQNPQASVFLISSEPLKEGELHRVKLAGIQPVESLAELEASIQRSRDAKRIERSDFPILVVEDLDSPRDIICIFIESLGFAQVEGVGSGAEALERLEKADVPISCVVTDIQMPGLDGRELIARIRESPSMRDLPIIVLTAYGTVDTLIDCLKAGASGFLVKPPKKDDLQRELARAMRIFSSGENARLANEQEAEYVRRMLEERKIG